MSKGQSLFEVVLALAVSTVIIVGIVALTTTSIRNATYSKNKTLAARYTEEATEWLRGQRDTDFTVFKDKAVVASPPSNSSTWCMQTLGWNVGNRKVCGSDDKIAGTVFKREVKLTSSQVSGKELIEADINVSWADAQGTHTVRSVTNFTDWKK